MGESIKELFSNFNYIFLFTSFIFLFGLYSAIAGVITSFMDPYGYGTSDTGVICLVFTISGIFNSFFIGTLLDKYQCYKKALCFLAFGSVLTLSLSIVGLPSGKVLVQALIMMFTGATMIPVVTVAFSFAAEVSYPVPESYSIGIMISVAQIFGFVLGLLLSYICANYDPRIGVAIWVVCAMISAVCASFVK